MSYDKRLIPGVQRDAVFDDVKHTKGYAYDLACKGRYNEALRYWIDQGNPEIRYDKNGFKMPEAFSTCNFETPEEKRIIDARLLARQQMTQCAETKADYHIQHCTFCSKEFIRTDDSNECSMKCQLLLAKSSKTYRKYLMKQRYETNGEG